ncbi:MAG: peptide chain release factor N(5)-glutamine methyltransferase [Steroidobacteraceae bacterium]
MTTVATIAQAVKTAELTLAPHSGSPRLDAELLLATLLDLPRSALIARGNEPVASNHENAYAELISRRAGGTPIAYLTGSREFWSLPFSVSPAVLVPRPETEILVEHALGLLPRDAVCSVLDLGTGSGAIALSLAHERPHWAITAVDISPAALDIAVKNAQNLQLSQVQWRLGRWFEPVQGERFHLIIANPPYIAANDPALVALRAEPVGALVAGPTGLEALGEIIAQAPGHLYARGWLALEHGTDQAPDVAQLLRQRRFDSIRTYSDFSGRPRVTLGVHTQH